MRVYISVDMEGIAGISHFRPTERGDSGYPAACDLMTGEANAAIEGALAAGALALGAVAIGCLVIGRAKIRRLEIGELIVSRLRVTDSIDTP